MKAYRMLFAAAAALGITSFALLAVRFTIFGFLLTAPGWPLGILFAVVSRSDSFLILPISTFLAYMGLILIIVSVSAQTASRERLRIWAIAISLPAVVLAALA